MLENRRSGAAGAARYLLGVLVFLTIYVVLDWASFIEPLGLFNITPWNPQPALAIAWMTLIGVSQWPVVFIALVLADVVVRDAPGGYAVTAGSAFTLAAGYATMALVLSRGLRDRRLQSTRDLGFFTATVLVGALIVGGAYVNVLAVANLLPDVPTTEAWLRFWVGDVVGILVTGPLIFALADPVGRARLAALVRDRRRWLEWAALCAVLALVLRGVPADITPHFYIVFVPIIWIALRSGMSGAIVAMVIVQLGVIIGLRRNPARQVPFVELQLLVCMLCVSALFLGVVVDERRRARAERRATLDKALEAKR